MQIRCDDDDVADSSVLDDRVGSCSSDNSRTGGEISFSTSVPIDVPTWIGGSVSQSMLSYHDDDDDVNLLMYFSH